MISGRPLPEGSNNIADPLIGPLIVGLTVSPDRLVQIRRNWLLVLKETAQMHILILMEFEQR